MAGIILMIIYACAVMAIVNKAFALIHILPDKVTRWLQGGATESLGADTSGGMLEQLKGGVEKGVSTGAKGFEGGMQAGAQLGAGVPKASKDAVEKAKQAAAASKGGGKGAAK